MNVSISKGKIIGLVGPDGAGKTTLIRLIAGLLTPTHGHISVQGYDTIQDAEYIHYLTGYMPQKFGLYEDLTVQQNLDLYAHLRNVVGKEKDEVCTQLLQFTGLKDFTGFLAKNLSGGMKQKLGLACALVKKPAFLLLDEPSVGVDPISRRELWKMVSVLAEEGISVLWSTAYLDEAEKCDIVLLLNEGELLYNGDPKKLTERMEGRVFVITHIEGDRRKLLYELLSDKNVMDGVIQGRDLRIVLRENGEKPAGVQMEAAAPRFEDAFIDILRGGPGGESKLADKMPAVKKDGGATIVAENLTKKFGEFTAVDNISLEVKKGEIFGLLGPNGAGKTTTFKMLCGLLRPTSGKASVKGLDLQKAPGEARAKLGYMAQKFSLYGNLSVRQNLEFFAGIYNLKNSQKKEAIEEMIEVFNLQGYLELSAETLPLGYKQRLSLACANMHHPEILFLDEPTSGVDPITRREFWNHINGLVRKGVTIMITTHFMAEAEYCDRIALVYQGKIIQMDTPNALKNRMKSSENPNPTLEDVFIQVIEEYDGK
ncbi:MAG: ABC transporter ATP-binding protein [Verrucomicrobia bacterium]|nr:ABC transporter ATP-binding protein [Verrucomicrobiota bacterium]